jgi:hypothetical protein
VVAKTDGEGDEEWASQDIREVNSDNRRHSLAVLDNILNAGESARSEEQALLEGIFSHR